MAYNSLEHILLIIKGSVWIRNEVLYLTIFVEINVIVGPNFTSLSF